MNSDYLVEQLLSLSNREEYIEIYHDYENVKNTFAVGYIIDIVDDYILYQCVAPDGRYDGFLAEPVTSISRICTETKYLKKIKKITSIDKSETEIDKLKNILLSTTGDLLHRLLSFSLSNNFCISLQLFDDSSEDITGTIESMTNSGICLKNIDEYGCFDGESYIRLSDIYRVICDGIAQRSLKELFVLSD